MTERKRLLLRLDPDVYERIARWAADDLRSVNAQIEYALRRALRAAGRAGPADTDEQSSADAGEDADAEADADAGEDADAEAPGDAGRDADGEGWVDPEGPGAGRS